MNIVWSVSLRLFDHYLRIDVLFDLCEGVTADVTGQHLLKHDPACHVLQFVFWDLLFCFLSSPISFTMITDIHIDKYALSPKNFIHWWYINLLTNPYLHHLHLNSILILWKWILTGSLFKRWTFVNSSYQFFYRFLFIYKRWRWR